MKDIEDAVTKYISALSYSYERTPYEKEHYTYVGHLAKAAIMLGVIHRGEPLSKLKSIIAEERHNYGWGYLQGSEGEAAEKAFNEFATFVENM